MIHFHQVIFIKTIKGSIRDLEKFQNDERFPQEIISKWLQKFDDWLQDAMQRKARKDVSIIYYYFHLKVYFNNYSIPHAAKEKSRGVR